MKLRCVIIDDEFLARKRLLKLLESFDNIVVVGECRNGNEALDLIPIKEPDLIFLDIQMPDMNGFTVVSKLTFTPHIIFTTAYDSYALKAFEINAVDYLLKPFDDERLNIAIERIKALKKKKQASLLEDKIKKLLTTYQSETSNYINEFITKVKGRDVSIYSDDILYFKSDGNYVQLVTDTKAHLYRTTLNSLSDNLDHEQFLRIHRSLIVNKFYIKSCSYISNNEYKFHLKNGEQLISSRSYKHLISEYLTSIE
ncbi:hypothetical protein A9Q87_08885 [Flavobacteriales bacterium 34_180_T64]|nr:hypothetical protein A9Q87_08885 [Flavobacteriales bacterium 34_180_T64]